MPNEVVIVLVGLVIFLIGTMFGALLYLQIEYTKLGNKYLDLLRERNARHPEP